MKLAIEIIKREIAQRELAQTHDHLRKDDVQLELESLYKAVKILTELSDTKQHLINYIDSRINYFSDGDEMKSLRQCISEYIFVQELNKMKKIINKL